MSAFERLPDGLETPALVVDRTTLDANIAGLQAGLDERGVRNRPHAKTHKSIAIGRLQVAAGAAGLTVGTLGEAEVFAAAGLMDLFIAYPLWFVGSKAERLRALMDVSELSVGVDSIDGVQALAAAVSGVTRRPKVLIEIDSGGQRTGVALPTDVLDIAEAVRDAGLALEGVFTHGGHSYGPGAAVPAAEDETRSLATAADALADVGFEVRTISAGTTPTRLLTTSPVNEFRAGTYVFGDRQQASVGAIGDDDVAIAVVATVVSVKDGRFVVDAGAKTLTKDRAAHLVGHGHLPAYPNAVIERLSDYHGVVVLPEGEPGPKIGDVLAIIPNHVCPVVDLFEFFTFVNADGSTERWPVDARGKSR